MDLTIKILKPELLNDYLYFFDNMTFSEYPEWSNCYCHEFYFTGSDKEWTKENNRKAVSHLISKGLMTGYLAYDRQIPVGWCNINKRGKYHSIERFNKVSLEPANNICSLVCFVVHPDYRHQGIASMLLEQACKDYKQMGYAIMEAYPAHAESSCEKNYKGPLSMYEKAGFTIHKTYEHLKVIRKEL